MKNIYRLAVCGGVLKGPDRKDEITSPNENEFVNTRKKEKE